MLKRSATYCATEKAKEVLPESMIESLVMHVVDNAYDKNLCIGSGVYAKRYSLLTLDGKYATGVDVLKALKYTPDRVQVVCPVVALIEDEGKDVVRVFLRSEIADDPVLKEAMGDFLETPPGIDLQQMIELAKADPSL